jgi:ATP/maltotriose-dependent transcriptional regulator MalT
VSSWWHDRARTLRASTRKPRRRIRIPRETALYGRDPELARLRGLWELARAGKCQVVLLEGEAGIGKSRLVDELVGQLEAAGEDLTFLWGSYVPGGAATAAGQVRRSLALRREIGHRDGVFWSLVELGKLRQRNGDVAGAREALQALADAGEGSRSPEVSLLLWRATGDLEHPRAAKRRLDERLALISERHHGPMCENLRVNREILAAWEAEIGSGRDPGAATWTQG